MLFIHPQAQCQPWAVPEVVETQPAPRASSRAEVRIHSLRLAHLSHPHSLDSRVLRPHSAITLLLEAFHRLMPQDRTPLSPDPTLSTA